MSELQWAIVPREKPRPEFEERRIEQEFAEAYHGPPFPLLPPKRPRKVPAS